jgi:hypothetical protein
MFLAVCEGEFAVAPGPVTLTSVIGHSPSQVRTVIQHALLGHRVNRPQILMAALAAKCSGWSTHEHRDRTVRNCADRSSSYIGARVKHDASPESR